ncbi:MAG: putative metal-dependent hydrolase [Chitinophagaceae bacterium]
MDSIKFPLGPFVFEGHLSSSKRKEYILDIEVLPKRLELLVQSLATFQLETSYRSGGWTINQIIHHLADSHMNMLIRLKLLLTEENPTIKPYQEALWAEMVDYSLPFNNSITLLYTIHQKITIILKSLNEDAFLKTYFHPEYNRIVTLDEVIAMYSWHGKHHIAQIAGLMNREKWD